MVYITGPDDTLKKLKEKDTPLGSLEAYEKICLMLNPEMCEKYPNWKQKLPPYTPVFLLFEDPVDPETRKTTWYEINKFTAAERQTLYELQEQGTDVAMQVAVGSMMEEFQQYAASVREWLKTPLILTPWKYPNEIITNKHIFKAAGESSSQISSSIKGTNHFRKLDELYEAMLARDEVNRKLHMLGDKKGVQGLRNSLEQQVKDLTKKIKQLLPKKLDHHMNKHLSSRFSPDVARRMRSNSYSVKAAGRGTAFTTNVQLLKQSGLGRLRMLVNGAKNVGKGLNYLAKRLNYGVVLYDTYEAYNNDGNVARTFITGALAVYLSSAAVTAVGGTTALGGLVIGSSSLALGSTVLLCCPVVGWTALVVGFVAAAAISYAAKKGLEGVWDLGEEVSKDAYKRAAEATKHMRQDFHSAWSENSDWLLEFYNKN